MNNDRSIETSEEDAVDFTAVQEALTWQRPAADLPRPSSAELAELGARLLDEIRAYRPDYRWVSSPAEIVGQLAEQIADLQDELISAKGANLANHIDGTTS